MPAVQSDYKSNLTSNFLIGATTFDVVSAPTLTAGVLVLNRGADNEEWIYMSSVTGLTITSSHRGLSKVLGTPTEVTADIKNHYAGETVEWVNHTVHQINKQGDTVYGDLLMNGTKQVQFGTTATAIYDNAGALTFKDAGAGTKTLASFVTTATKLDDLAAPDDNTDLNATTSAHGLLPKLDGGTNTFLRGDGAFATPSGGGNVSNITSVTDNEIVRWDGATGTVVQASSSKLEDDGSINLASGAVYKINGSAISKSTIGLGNVDNTSDATRNAATVTLTNKTLTSPVINSPTGIVKGDVGLGSVDNFATASQAEAEAGTDNAKFMTPLRTKQAIDYQKYYCSLYNSGNITLVDDNPGQIVTFDSEYYDSSSFHSTSTNTGRLTIPSGLGGLYLISWNIRTGTPDGIAQFRVCKNGQDAANMVYHSAYSTDTYESYTGSMFLTLSENDYIQLQVFRNTGVVVITGGTVGLSANFGLFKIN